MRQSRRYKKIYEYTGIFVWDWNYWWVIFKEEHLVLYCIFSARLLYLNPFHSPHKPYFFPSTVEVWWSSTRFTFTGIDNSFPIHLYEHLQGTSTPIQPPIKQTPHESQGGNPDLSKATVHRGLVRCYTWDVTLWRQYRRLLFDCTTAMMCGGLDPVL